VSRLSLLSRTVCLSLGIMLPKQPLEAQDMLSV
jgi:hypothetical protein